MMKRTTKILEKNFLVYICNPFAGVVKLVDTPDLGSGAARCVGSSPSTRTLESLFFLMSDFFIQNNYIKNPRFCRTGIFKNMIN